MPTPTATPAPRPSPEPFSTRLSAGQAFKNLMGALSPAFDSLGSWLGGMLGGAADFVRGLLPQ